MEVKLAAKTALVTGGTGFIGGNLVKTLIKKFKNVIVVDIENNPRSLFSQSNLPKYSRLEIADIRDEKIISELFKKHKPSHVFHLAATTIVPYAYQNPLETFETNIMGTVNILEAARKLEDVEAIIVASSDKAYGKLTTGKYKEEDPLKGDHPYDVSKSSADLISHSYFVTYGLPITVTRFGNVYGPGDLNFSRIIPGIIKSVLKNEKLLIRSDGNYVRDYLHVDDVVEGYVLLAENISKVKGEAFNFGSHETLSVLELISLIEGKLKITIDYEIQNTAKNELPYQSLDFSKIQKLLKWQPQHSIPLTIKEIFKWYEDIL